nr:MAG TPA: hypothetical protein [Caudoviricetes sp.]
MFFHNIRRVHVSGAHPVNVNSNSCICLFLT